MYQIVEQINEIVGNYRKERAVLKNENRTYRESITSISHDIRTPLTSVKGYLQMLSGSCICEEKQQAYIKVVEERVDDVTNMLNQLFEYTRVEAGEWEFHMEQLNLTNIFMDTISMFYDDFVQRDCEPRLEIPQIPCFVYGDRQACIRIIENLIKNALVHGTGEYSFCMKRKRARYFWRYQTEQTVSNQKTLTGFLSVSIQQICREPENNRAWPGNCQAACKSYAW